MFKELVESINEFSFKRSFDSGEMSSKSVRKTKDSRSAGLGVAKIKISNCLVQAAVLPHVAAVEDPALLGPSGERLLLLCLADLEGL